MFPRQLLLGLVIWMALPFTASASSTYPAHAITYVIPFTPGGESDISARLQQPFFKEKSGQELVISYKPGEGGAAGWSELNALKPDGYTIMGVNMPHIVLQPARGEPGYRTDELEVVYWFHYTPDAIFVRRDSPFKTLQDLIDYAKQRPGKLVFSGSGSGTANHLAQVTFDNQAGIQTGYVPFKGTGASITALLGGQVGAAWGYSTSGTAFGGKARMLAVATEKRHPRYTHVPTFKELGFDLVSGAYRGIAVPKGTPESVKKKLSGMIGEINADPAFQRRMEARGFALIDVPYMKADQFLKKKAEDFLAAAREGGFLTTVGP